MVDEEQTDDSHAPRFRFEFEFGSGFGVGVEVWRWGRVRKRLTDGVISGRVTEWKNVGNNEVSCASNKRKPCS